MVASLIRRSLRMYEYMDHHVPLHEPAAEPTPWPTGFRSRHRWQNAFFQWHSENQDHFTIRLELLKHTDTSLSVGFREISRVVTAAIRHNEIVIYAEWLGFCWDILREFETFPQKVSGGYACSQCPEDDCPVFDSPGALRRAEVFEHGTAVGAVVVAADCGLAIVTEQERAAYATGAHAVAVAPGGGGRRLPKARWGSR
jgi:hypothetical protein